jgi:hypothetical protein
VEHREPHGLLDLGVALHLDVGALPVLLEERALFLTEPVPTREPGARRRRDHLVVDRRP